MNKVKNEKIGIIAIRLEQEVNWFEDGNEGKEARAAREARSGKSRKEQEGEQMQQANHNTWNNDVSIGDIENMVMTCNELARKDAIAQ